MAEMRVAAVVDPLKLKARTSDPPVKVGVVKVYCKLVAGVAELFAEDDAGNVYQLTPGGAGPGVDTSAYHSTDAVLVPAADAFQTLGTAARRLNALIGNQHLVFAALGNANPTAELSDRSLRLGLDSADNLSFLLEGMGAGVALIPTGKMLQITDSAVNPDDVVTKKDLTGGGGADVGCRLTFVAADQVLAAVRTPINFDTAEYDTAGMFNILNPTRITIPSNGKYQVGGAFYAATGGAICQLGIRKNGADYLTLVEGRDPAPGVVAGLNTVTEMSLVAGDYLELIQFSNLAGGPLYTSASVGLGGAGNWTPVFWARKVDKAG